MPQAETNYKDRASNIEAYERAILRGAIMRFAMRDRRLSNAEFRGLYAFVDQARDASAVVYRTAEQLALDTGIGIQMAERLAAKLEALGYLTYSHKENGVKRYALRLPDDRAGQEAVEVERKSVRKTKTYAVAMAKVPDLESLPYANVSRVERKAVAKANRRLKAQGRAEANALMKTAKAKRRARIDRKKALAGVTKSNTLVLEKVTLEPVQNRYTEGAPKGKPPFTTSVVDSTPPHDPVTGELLPAPSRPRTIDPGNAYLRAKEGL